MSVSPKFWALGGDLAPGSPDLPLPLVIPGFVSASGEGKRSGSCVVFIFSLLQSLTLNWTASFIGSRARKCDRRLHGERVGILGLGAGPYSTGLFSNTPTVYRSLNPGDAKSPSPERERRSPLARSPVQRARRGSRT